ncbi:MAG: PilZ domain-containing protein [Proteobacteria bacterium]|nr:PilZ domain-containing protein [Pseudomonadota bacterium]
MENRRQFFRLEYPAKSGPRFLSGGVSYQVLDISEQGMRLGTHSNRGLKVGGKFAGSLTFTGGETFLVYGIVKRITEETVAIQLAKPIPYRIIMAEQRRIIQLLQKRA